MASPDPTGVRRWDIYQRERFPLAAHGPLILAFSFCAVSFSAHLRHGGWPRPGAAAVAFVSSLVFFLQLRIADEFKDREEDARYRPYRPVPRGLVHLRELGVLFALGGLLQLALALWWSPPQVLVLLIAWTYLALMSVEFGVRTWLKRHPITYLWSHMLIMPLVDFYATACDWVPAHSPPPSGLWWFLAASFANGLVIELGRKIRSPADEEPGVETYSVLWGPQAAARTWALLVVATAVLGTLAASRAHAAVPVGVALGLGAALCLALGQRFRARLAPRGGRRLELGAGLWTLLLYGSLGLIPPLWEHWHG